MPDKALIESKKAKLGIIGTMIGGAVSAAIIGLLTAQGVDPTEAAKVAVYVCGAVLSPILAAIFGQTAQDTAREKANGKPAAVYPRTGDPMDKTGAG